ncbi:MAG TPA: hypothetical protein VE985_00225 [Gaiellaceae bacterium]|nr:hypothetical protein [Gaiellaceae bacterium]
MNTSESRSWAFVGPLTIAFWIVGLVLLTDHQPGDHATGGQILAWYKAHTDSILLGGWLFMIGCLGFVAFVASVGRRLAAPALALAGGAIAGVAGMLTAATDVAGGLDKNDIGPATAATFHHAVDLFFITAELTAVLPLAVVAVVAWRTRALPRWWAAFSGLVAVVLLVGPIGWLGVIFGMPIWILGTSLFVLLGSRAPLRTAAAAA